MQPVVRAVCPRMDASVTSPEVAKIAFLGGLLRLKKAVAGRLKESKVKPDLAKATILFDWFDVGCS